MQDLLLYNYSDPAAQDEFQRDYAAINSATYGDVEPLFTPLDDAFAPGATKVDANSNNINYITNKWAYNVFGNDMARINGVCGNSTLALRKLRIADWELVPQQNEQAMLKVEFAGEALHYIY